MTCEAPFVGFAAFDEASRLITTDNREYRRPFIVRWPNGIFGPNPKNLGETILLHFLIDMMVLIKN